MATATMTSKGQITLPKGVRESLALKKGDRLRVEVDGAGRVTLEREDPPALDQAFGVLHRLAGRRPVTIEEMRSAVRRRAREKVRGR